MPLLKRTRLVLAFLSGGAALAAPARLAAQFHWPETPAAKQMARLVEALNSGDPAALGRFVESAYARSALEKRPAAERAAKLTEVFEETRGLEVRKIDSSSEWSVEVHATDRRMGDWVQMRLDLDPADPHGVLGFGLRDSLPPPEFRRAKAPGDAELARELGEYLKKLAAEDLFSGTVLVVHEGKPVYQQAFGLASRAWQQPNRMDTKFNLGSMNKMFTAVAIAQLAEARKLSFAEKVGAILPDYPNAEVREKVSIHHLLTHTSGMGSYFNDEYDKADKNRFRAVKDYLPLFVNEKLQFEPGARWDYSNSGFMLLGLIIEKASGQDYFDYVREHIYKPAGMTDTDAYELDKDQRNLAMGYTKSGPDGKNDPTRGWNNLFLHVVKGGPAGGGFSTAGDLVKFAEALRGGKLLGAKYVEIVTTGKVAIDPEERPTQYAYGLFDDRSAGTRIVGHSGGFPGINSRLDMYFERGYNVAVMSNYDPPAAEKVASKIRGLLAP
jgi:CubicO group peptidase (beta-lactamase class C family)